MSDETERTTDYTWWIYRGLSDEELAACGTSHLESPISGKVQPLPEHVQTLLHPDTAPPWRRFDRRSKAQRGANFIVDDDVKARVNTALVLRRPLLITGPPGTGKTSLVYAVARELGLEPVAHWSITSRTELRDGLYSYDAIARLQDTQRYLGITKSAGHGDEATMVSDASGEESAKSESAESGTKPPSIEDYLKLGPLGAAFAGFQDAARAHYPRVLLIDEIDKSDIDLPNDLLHIFEEGGFDIDELKRDAADSHCIETFDADGTRVTVRNGRVECQAFPFVVLTSNSEREFPAPFLRRCIQLEMQRPNKKRLADIVRRKLRHIDPEAYRAHEGTIGEIIDAFVELGKTRDLATDQLLQVILLRMKDIDPFEGVRPLTIKDHGKLIGALWKSLRDERS